MLDKYDNNYGVSKIKENLSNYDSKFNLNILVFIYSEVFEPYKKVLEK